MMVFSDREISAKPTIPNPSGWNGTGVPVGGAQDLQALPGGLAVEEVGARRRRTAGTAAAP